jgi:hypothetical protein
MFKNVSFNGMGYSNKKRVSKFTTKRLIGLAPGVNDITFSLFLICPKQNKQQCFFPWQA